MHTVGILAVGVLCGVAVLLGGLGLLFLLAPLVVRFTTWQAAEPAFFPREPQPESGEVDAWFDAVGPILADAGYREAQRWTIRGLHHRASIDVLILVHRGRRVVASAFAIHALAGSSWRLKTRVVEFSSRRQDGWVLVTSNTPSVLPRTEWAHKRVQVFERIQDPLALESIHIALRDREAGAIWEDPPPVVGMPAAFLLNMRKDLETLAADGWMRFDAKSNLYRLTLRGAYPLTWRELWPVSSLVRRRLRRTADSLVAHLDLPAPRSPASPGLSAGG